MKNGGASIEIKKMCLEGDVRQCEEFSFSMINKIMDELVVVLNEQHQVDFSRRYWKILVRPWLRMFVENVVFYMTNSENELVERKTELIVPVDYDSFLELIIDKEWISYVRSLLREASLFSEEELFYNFSSISIYNPFGEKIKPYSISSLLRSLLDWASRYMQGGCVLDFKDPSLLFGILHRLKLVPRIPEKRGIALLDEDIDLSSRRHIYRLRKKVFSSEVERIIWLLVCSNIPLAYLEQYKSAKEVAINRYGKFPSLFVEPNIHFKDLYKLWLAEGVECGAQLIVTQHGGGYGIVSYDYTEIHEKDVADLYLSWHRSDAVNVVQVPSYKKMEVQGENEKSGVITLVNMSYQNFHKYNSLPIGDQARRNIEDQLTFLRLVNGDVKRKIHVRQCPVEYDWPISEMYEEAGFADMVDNTRGYYDLVRGSEFVVLSYMGTSWLETLMNNIPSVVFIDRRSWPLREEVMSFVDELKEVGVLHETPESAALFVNKIDGNVRGWWKSDPVQRARVRFCQNVSYTDENWQNKWLDAIEKIV